GGLLLTVAAGATAMISMPAAVPNSNDSEFLIASLLLVAAAYGCRYALADRFLEGRVDEISDAFVGAVKSLRIPLFYLATCAVSNALLAVAPDEFRSFFLAATVSPLAFAVTMSRRFHVLRAVFALLFMWTASTMLLFYIVLIGFFSFNDVVLK